MLLYVKNGELHWHCGVDDGEKICHAGGRPPTIGRRNAARRDAQLAGFVNEPNVPNGDPDDGMFQTRGAGGKSRCCPLNIGGLMPANRVIIRPFDFDNYRQAV